MQHAACAIDDEMQGDGGSYGTEDIEAALGAAERLLQLPPWQVQEQPQEEPGERAAPYNIGSTGVDGALGVAAPQEATLSLRLALHGREMELLRLRQEHAQALVSTTALQTMLQLQTSPAPSDSQCVVAGIEARHATAACA